MIFLRPPAKECCLNTVAIPVTPVLYAKVSAFGIRIASAPLGGFDSGMTFLGFQSGARGALVYVLVMSLGVTQLLAAPAQVVTPQELRAAIARSTQVQEQHRANVVRLLSTSQAERGLGLAKVDPNLVKSAISSLNEEELAQLSARAVKAEADFAAGRLSDRDLLWVLVGIAALILVIVAVR